MSVRRCDQRLLHEDDVRDRRRVDSVWLAARGLSSEEVL